MEESTQRQQEIRSAEVQEIISQVPDNIVRWGMTALFGVISILLVISWFIKYPDVLPAAVTITTTPAPLTSVSRQGGTLVLLKTDNSSITKDELIGYIKSNAQPMSVLALEKSLLEQKSFSAPEELGDLQAPYAAFKNAEVALMNFSRNKSITLQITQLTKQIQTYTKLGISLTQQRQLTEQELILASERFKIDSVLYAQKVIAAVDFNTAKATWLQQQRSAKNAETALLNNEIQLNQLQQQVTDLEIKRKEQQKTLELELQHAREALFSSITSWKEQFLFIASFTGVVSYLGFLENGQHVDASTSLFAVIPQQGKLVARAELPVVGSGKVKEGQPVTIRLNNYPYEQFGMIKGIVADISLMPSGEKYRLSIDISQEMITTYNKKLEFKQQLSGTTNIVTEDLRLLERFFYQFRKLSQIR